MNNLKKILLLNGLLLLAACSSSTTLPAVSEVDLNKFQGLWFDIAHLPNDQLENCDCITAKINQLESDLEILYTCQKSDEMLQNTFMVKPVEETQFTHFQREKGTDWVVLELAENYRYAMVGAKNRKELYIISRTPEPAARLMKEYLNKAEELNFDTSKIIYTDQGCYAEAVEDNP